MISRVVTASTGVGTTPIRPAYFGIAHTALIDDLENATNCPSFIPTNKYETPRYVHDKDSLFEVIVPWAWIMRL